MQYRTRYFTWLVFLEYYEALIADAEKLSIPYNCQFILSFSDNSATYKLIEIYNVKNRTFRIELGVFHDNKISLNNGFLYSSRMNLNGTTLELNYGYRSTNAPSAQIQNSILNELVEIMNSQFVPQVFSSSGREIQIPGDAHESIFPFHSDFFRYDIVAPIYRSL